jgi:hypothetical protein
MSGQLVLGFAVLVKVSPYLDAFVLASVRPYTKSSLHTTCVCTKQ